MSIPKEGAKAPGFKLDSLLGKIKTLADYKGRWLVLYFYPKDLTSGCTQEAIDFTKAGRKLKALGAEVVGVSRDSMERHQKFADKFKLKIDLLADEAGDMCKTYGVYKKKKLYGHEFMGIERTTFIIDPSGKIRKIFPKVKVKGHVDSVVDFLKASQ